MNGARNVLVLGATGLVGRKLLTFLLRDPSVFSVLALVRRAHGLPDDSKLRIEEIDFDNLERYNDLFHVDQIFCALGTTISQAKSRERFRIVDHDYPVTAARLARAAATTHYLLVSAMGAHASSRIFYNRVKGETERDIIALGFPSVTVARPSLLTGRRREVRFGERVGHLLGMLAPPSIRPIPAKDVAAALTLAARSNRLGTHILSSRDMRGASMQLG